MTAAAEQVSIVAPGGKVQEVVGHEIKQMDVVVADESIGAAVEAVRGRSGGLATTAAGVIVTGAHWVGR